MKSNSGWLRRSLEAARATLGLALRRARARARLSSLLLVGSFLAIGLAAAAPIYLDAIRDLGLRSLVREAEPGSLDLAFQITVPTTPESVTATAALLDTEVTTAAEALVADRGAGLQSPGFIVQDAPAGYDSQSGEPRAFFRWQAGFDDLVRISAGVPPGAWNGDGPLPVAISNAAAERFGLQLGDRLLLQPFWLSLPATTEVEIAGRFEAIDTTDPRWVGRTGVGDLHDDFGVPLWVAQDALFALAAQAPQMRSVFAVTYFTDASGLRGREADALGTALVTLDTRLAQQLPDLRQGSELPGLLSSFDNRFTFAQSTMLVIILELAAVLLLYLVITSTMVAEQSNDDIAWFRSRGASFRRIGAIQFVESVILTVPPVVLGPFIALGLVSLMGLVPPFSDLTEGTFLSVRTSALSWILALGVGALAVVAQFVPTTLAARATVVTARRLRGRPGSNWRARLVVDGFTLVLAALLIFELRRDSTTALSAGDGEASLNLLRVGTPAILLFATGLVVLRLFPFAVRFASHVLGGLSLTTPFLSFIYVGRAPKHYGRLVLIMLVVGATAVFTASFKSTLDRSYDDRAAYSVGSSVRIVGSEARALNVARAEKRLGGAPTAAVGDDDDGAPVLAPVQRFSGRLSADTESNTLTLLTTDSEALAAAIYTRDDFAADSLPEMIRRLPAPAPADALLIPDVSGSIGIWARFVAAGSGTGLTLRLRDSQGTYFEYWLGFVVEAERESGELFVPRGQAVPVRLVDGSGQTLAIEEAVHDWVFLERPLATPDGVLTLQGRRTMEVAARSGIVTPIAPLELVSISLVRFGSRSSVSGSVLLDDLTWRSPDGPVLLDDFAQAGWEAIPPSALQLPLENAQLVDADVISQPLALELAWAATRVNFDSGIRRTRDNAPIPALMSEDLLARSRVAVGEVTRITSGNAEVTVRVVGALRQFPTFDPNGEAGLVLLDHAAFTREVLSGANAGSLIPVQQEFWVAAGGLDHAAVLRALGIDAGSPDLLSARAERAALEADPLVVAGWNGLFAAALAAIAVAAAFGMTALTVFTTQARAAEFAVLRSVGITIRQLLGLVILEQALVIVVGLSLGLLVGIAAGPILLDFFALTPDGRDAIPPLIFQIDWRTLGFVIAAIGGLFVVNTLGALIFLWRMRLQSMLRLAI